MGSEGGNKTTHLSILEEARRNPGTSFRAAVAFLERVVGSSVRVGDYGPVGQEPIRFRHDSSLYFPVSDISSIDLSESAPEVDGRSSAPPFDVMTTFLGLTGSSSPLPSYILEEVVREDDGKMRDFLDVFHHRFISLFYRAVSRYDYSTEFCSDATDVWSQRIMALAGLDVFEKEDSSALPRWQILRLASLLTGQNSSAWSLQRALEDVLSDVLGDAKVEIEQFIGAWVPVDKDDRIQLGKKNHVLGQNTTLGKRVYDVSGKFRIHMGPLSKKAYNTLYHDPKIREKIRAVVALCSRDSLDHDLELELDSDSATAFTVSATSPFGLGIDTFLGQPERKEALRVVVDLSSVPHQEESPAKLAPASFL